MKRLSTAICTVLLTHALAPAAAPLDPLGPEMPARYPAITVPQATRTPVLDGKVNKGEYGPLAALHDLVTYIWVHDGMAEPLRISPPEAVAYPIWS